MVREIVFRRTGAINLFFVYLYLLAKYLFINPWQAFFVGVRRGAKREGGQKNEGGYVLFWPKLIN